jgi:hypothetical protein
MLTFKDYNEGVRKSNPAQKCRPAKGISKRINIHIIKDTDITEQPNKFISWVEYRIVNKEDLSFESSNRETSPLPIKFKLVDNCLFERNISWL